jgi:hypothetical protein
MNTHAHTATHPITSAWYGSSPRWQHAPIVALAAGALYLLLAMTVGAAAGGFRPKGGDRCIGMRIHSRSGFQFCELELCRPIHVPTHDCISDLLADGVEGKVYQQAKGGLGDVRLAWEAGMPTAPTPTAGQGTG